MSDNNPLHWSENRVRSVPKINTSVPHPARIYDYWLGGKDNFEADRAAAEQVIAAVPEVRFTARDNRAFLGRAVRFLAKQGVRQFLDIGTGIPTQDNTHQVAQAAAPESRVVYVDNDPIVMAHAQALMTSASEGKTAYVQADLREPETILTHEDVLATLDFDEPAAVLFVAILMFIKDAEDPYALVRRITDAMPKGSYLVVSHVSSDLLSEAAIARTKQAYSAASASMNMRSHAGDLTLLRRIRTRRPWGGGAVPMAA
jgi:hypothetical protein